MKRTILIIICLTGLVFSQQKGTKVSTDVFPTKQKGKYSNIEKTVRLESSLYLKKFEITIFG